MNDAAPTARGDTLLQQAITSLRQGNPLVDPALYEPLTELLEDAAQGDDEGVINPYVEAVAAALLGSPLTPARPTAAPGHGSAVASHSHTPTPTRSTIS
ncbi:hypothetical protein ACFYZ9_28885 [Streptomyces sp. NPDC001691]|uniref:hypothetical protein n=1 Tax=Streptomyces sp. NPDC001691 TaxID=3364600 RepID=UPI0036C12B4F